MRHRVLGVHELLEQILLFLTSPRDLLHTALVCRSFVGVALHVLWRKHQFSLGPLLRCAPKPVRPRSSMGNLATMTAPYSTGREVAAWVPFRQYAHSMSVLSYSDKYDAHERFLHCITIPNVLYAIQGVLCSTPLFPLLKRLIIIITRPGGWLDDFLPHIPSCRLQYLWIEYHANHLFSDGILDLIAHLSERTPSLRRLKLRLYGRYLARNAPQIDLFANPEKHSTLQVLFLDCAFLSPLSFARIGKFPSLRHLTVCLQETTMPQLLSDSLSFDHLVRLNLRVTRAKLAILFLQRIGSTIPEVTHLSISIHDILPFDRDFGEISYQIRRLCLPTSFENLEILFKEQALGNRPPPLVSETPGYGLHMFQPLLDFSLLVLNVSVKLPLFPPTQSYVTQMASAWINLISIRIDAGRLVPFDRHLAVSICDLIPFFQACKCLRRLYIPFQYLISKHLPIRGIHAYALLDLGLGYVNPSSRDALFLAQWLQIVAPGLPEVTLADANGDTGVYLINDLAKIEETMADSNF